MTCIQENGEPVTQHHVCSSLTKRVRWILTDPEDPCSKQMVTLPTGNPCFQDHIFKKSLEVTLDWSSCVKTLSGPVFTLKTRLA